MVWYNGEAPLYDAVRRHNAAPANEHRKEPVHNEAKPCSQNLPQHTDPLSSLLRDRDSLLIAAMLLILMHEKADKKLILALAFVLFS